MERMNSYLEENDGYYFKQSKLVNIKILKNNQICCYFVTGKETNDKNWHENIKNNIFSDLQVLPSFIELRNADK